MMPATSSAFDADFADSVFRKKGAAMANGNGKYREPENRNWVSEALKSRIIRYLSRECMYLLYDEVAEGRVERDLGIDFRCNPGALNGAVKQLLREGRMVRVWVDGQEAVMPQHVWKLWLDNDPGAIRGVIYCAEQARQRIARRPPQCRELVIEFESLPDAPAEPPRPPRKVLHITASQQPMSFAKRDSHAI